MNLHFEITPAGRVKFKWRPNDTRLDFYRKCNKRPRKASTVEAVGKAFIRIAKKAKELGQYQ